MSHATGTLLWYGWWVLTALAVILAVGRLYLGGGLGWVAMLIWVAIACILRLNVRAFEKKRPY